MKPVSRLVVVAIASLAIAGCTSTGGSSGPGQVVVADVSGSQGAEEGPFRKQLWLVPSPQAGRMMRAVLYRPEGDGPFPLAVVNHGSDQDGAKRSRMGMPQFDGLTGWLVARGYAVLLPQRPGHGATGGSYLEDQGSCGKADYAGAGRATADSIAAAIGFMTQQSFIRPTGAVVIGHSAGGWGGLALAARNPANVGAVVSFAGGRGGRNRGKAGENCSPDRLVAAAGEFGRTARVPTLWLYAENDSFFSPSLSRRMADAFTTAGGRAEYHLLPARGAEGHFFMSGPPEEAGWAAPLRAFLSANEHLAQR